MVGPSKFRAVAIDAPHRGYDWQYFEATFEQLRCVLDEAQKLHQKQIVGGDFNLQIDIRTRGEEFQHVVDVFGLLTTNLSDTPWDNQWTFKSNMGVRQNLDYILVSKSLQLIRGAASNLLDLGSDHRSVKAVINTSTSHNVLFCWWHPIAKPNANNPHQSTHKRAYTQCRHSKSPSTKFDNTISRNTSLHGKHARICSTNRRWIATAIFLYTRGKSA